MREKDLAELFAKNKNNSILCQLLQDQASGLVFTESSPIALREIKNIYRLRAKRNENMGEPIQGFQELICGLDAFSADAVVIYSAEFASGSYKVFADAARTEMAGVLKWPKQHKSQY